MVGIDKYKKDKILEGVINKGRTWVPEREYKITFLIDRLQEEVDELMEYCDYFEDLHDDMMAYHNDRISLKRMIKPNAEVIEKVLKEVADISNFADFIFNAICIRLEDFREIEEKERA